MSDGGSESWVGFLAVTRTVSSYPRLALKALKPGGRLTTEPGPGAGRGAAGIRSQQCPGSWPGQSFMSDYCGKSGA
eukprot:767247-Hanusia_phi.AAC.1